MSKKPEDATVTAAQKITGWVVRNWKVLSACVAVALGGWAWGWSQYTKRALEAAHSVDTRQSYERTEMEARLTKLVADESNKKDIRLTAIEAKVDVLLRLQGVDPAKVAITQTYDPQMKIMGTHIP